MHARALQCVALRWQIWWGRRFRLPSCTGPGPVFRRAHQTGINRVRFNVRYGSVELIRVAKIVVPGLVLPERLTGSTQYPIRVPRGRSFQPSHQHRHGNPRKNQQMHVVRHDHPGTQFVKVSLGLPGHNSAGNQISDTSVREPALPSALPIQSTVLSHEGLSGSCLRSGSGPGRQRSPQAPGQEEVSMMGMIVGQPSAVFGHEEEWQAKPPAPPKGLHWDRRISRKCRRCPQYFRAARVSNREMT